MTSRLAGLLALTLLAACAGGADRVMLTAEGIRPGVGSQIALDRLRPRVGQTVVYRFDGNGGPVRIEGRWRIATIRGGTVTLLGQIETIVPGVDLRETVDQFTAEFGQSPLEVQGDRLITPFNATTDTRMRTLTTQSLLDRSRYDPHDCFATLGICRFAQTTPDGAVRHILAETTEEDGIWRETRRLDPERTPGGRNTLIAEAVYSIDSQAMVIDAKFADYEGPTAQTTRMVRLR